MDVHKLYLKDLQDIDDENDQKQRCDKAKNLQNHQYLKLFASLNWENGVAVMERKEKLKEED